MLVPRVRVVTKVKMVSREEQEQQVCPERLEVWDRSVIQASVAVLALQASEVRLGRLDSRDQLERPVSRANRERRVSGVDLVLQDR